MSHTASLLYMTAQQQLLTVVSDSLSLSPREALSLPLSLPLSLRVIMVV
jgi:hypothetical protein